MAIIYSYPQATPSINDMVLGVKFKANKKISTNSFYISDLVALIQGEIGTTPTLQQVLDNNHDLVDNNNFQGTFAGDGGLGQNVNGFGNFAANSNTGNNVNALGQVSANGNAGNGVNALGEGSAQGNSGNVVNAFGPFASANNSGNNGNFFGSSAGFNNIYNNVNLFGEAAQADEDGQTVLSKDGAIMARLSTIDLTETRKYNLPDADGTIALTSDIPVPAYKVYTILLTQTGEGDPQVTELENTLGVTPIWTYLATGFYQTDWVFGTNFRKIYYNITNKGSVAYEFRIGFGQNGPNFSIFIQTFNSGVLTNGLLANTPIEIRVYN